MTSPINEAIKAFNAELHVENVNQDNDEGVAEVLAVLDIADDKPYDDTEASRKLSGNSITRPKLVASLSFLKKELLSVTTQNVLKVKKPELKDMVLQLYKIKMPSLCLWCDSVYQCQNQSELINCIICNQGMCPKCAPKQDISNLTQYGHVLHALCVSCVTNLGFESGKSGSLPATQLSQDLFPLGQGTPISEVEDEVLEEDDETILNTLSKSKSSPSSSLPLSSSSANKKEDAAICSFFKQNRCKHGQRGQGCTFNHPKICFPFTKKGPKGCKKAQECQYFHPKLCKTSVSDGICLKDNCKFLHLPKTARSSKVNDPVNKESKSSPNLSEQSVKLAGNSSQSSVQSSAQSSAQSSDRSPVQSSVFPTVQPPEAPDNLVTMMAMIQSISVQLANLMKDKQERISKEGTWAQIVQQQQKLNPAQQQQSQPVSINGLVCYPQQLQTYQQQQLINHPTTFQGL